MEDYTGKYKGEQVEVALFGGEYQEGVLTAYCYVDEVAHIELNGHILVPLQNIASLHCSSRCDAQANEDWPPRGLLDDDGSNGSGPRPTLVRFIAVRNIVKAWLLLLGICGVLGSDRLGIGGLRLLSIFVFCGLLLVTGAYWTFDRVVLGMVRARELPIAEAPLLHSTVERLAARAGVLKPRST